MVENQTWSDLDVYIEREGVRFRLGTVPSQGTGRFFLDHVFQNFQLIADPVGSQDVLRSELIPAIHGSTAVWTLAARGRISRVSLR